LGAQLASPGQNRFRIGEIDIADPDGSGTPMLFPELLYWRSVGVFTGLMPAHLMQAMPPLARASRYGDVRRTPTEALLAVVAALFERVVVGLRASCTALDADAAAQRLDAMIAFQESLAILDDAGRREEWAAVLLVLADDDAVHGLVRGWSCRALLEHGKLSTDELDRRAGLALSPVTPALDAAAWLEGLLRGAGIALVHLDGVWRALDRFLVALEPDTFQEMLPLLRRAFSHFTAPERRSMGERVKDLRPTNEGQGRRAEPRDAAIDPARAAGVIPVLARILGVERP